MRINTLGQTLVEALVALGIATIVITALVTVTTVSLSRSQFVKDRTQAQKYAEEGLEWVRAERNNNDWDTYFLPKSSSSGITYCLNTLSWTSGSCLGYLNSIFKRQAILTRDTIYPTTKIKAQITVSWQEGGRTHYSDQTTYLTKWQ